MRSVSAALVIMALLTGFTPVVRAADTQGPPLRGQMTKLEVYPQPIQLPEIMLSHAPQGLTYLSEFKGKMIVLNIWATWCPPCVQELPSLNALQTSFKSPQFEVVAVSIDQSGLEAVKKYLEDKKLTQLTPFVDANSDIQRLEPLRDVAGVPVTLIIDPYMRLVARYQGDADWNGADAMAVMEYYLKDFQGRGLLTPL